MTRLRTALLAATTALLALTACSSVSDAGSDGDGTPQHGGDLQVAATSDPASLDPFRFTAQVDENVISNIYDRVITRNPHTYELAPGIAKSWTVSKDGRTVVLHLQRDVRFHDGRPMTSRDVVFSIDQARHKDSTRTHDLLSSVTRVTGTDASTVTITLARPDTELLQTLVLVYVARDRAKPDYDQDPDGTGPFRFEQWLPNVRLVLKRNKHYWRKPYPYLDSVTFRIVSDETTALLQLQNRQVDVLGALPFGQQKEAKADGLRMPLPPNGVAGGYYEFIINTSHGPLADPRVRQAVSWAVDRPALEKVLPSIYRARSNPVPRTSKNFSSTAASYPRQDKAKAKALLADAGHPHGVDLGTMYVYANLGEDYKVLAQVLQQQEADAGIRFDIQLYDVATWADKVLAKKAYGIALGAEVPHPSDYDYVAHTWGNQIGAATDWQKQNPAFYKLLASVRTNTDPARYTAQLKQLQDTAMVGEPIIIVGDRTIPPVLSRAVHGFVTPPEDYLYFATVWKN